MSEIRIKIEDLSKQYRLGEVGTGSIIHDLNRFWHRIRGKEDPYAMVAVENDRTKATNSEYVWALKDINFEVREGEVLGIIGRNGAGKSTLLKLLSQVSGPTTGQIKINGRIGSLLEVGTGMHPELTGRENIYLNGAILGMSRQEIERNFDEIVEFSGIAAYIDTPLKRYSSGMRVRLGFAVAAFLEPEILIIDEVLAVGDAEFQRKAIGKMKEVSQSGGRTVLFVSHNMEAIKNLCSRAILMENGQIKMEGSPHEMVEEYLKKNAETSLSRSWLYEEAPGNEWIRVERAAIEAETAQENGLLTVKTAFNVHFDYWVEQDNFALNLSLHLYAATGECVFNVTTELPAQTLQKGKYSATCKIPGNLLNTGVFSISCMFVKDETVPVFNLEDQLVFEIHEERKQGKWHGKFPGFVRPELDFTMEKA